MDAILDNIIKRHLKLLDKTLQITQHVLADVNQTDATTYRDGAAGWTVLEVLCHLRDFEQIFHSRARQILERDEPSLMAYDHEALVIENAYAQQDLQEVLAALGTARGDFIAFFQGLSESDWLRAGIHPESGRFTLVNSLLQVGHHHVDHLEQITRILTQHDEAD